MFINGGISNVDAIWDEPSAVRFYDRLASLGRVIQYDMRGSGVSDPIPGDNTWLPLEGNMDDVRAVLDAAGSERAVIYGDTEGGLSAMMLAATHPERVSALVLVNAVPRIPRPTTTRSGHRRMWPTPCPSNTSPSTAPRVTCCG